MARNNNEGYSSFFSSGYRAARCHCGMDDRMETSLALAGYPFPYSLQAGPSLRPGTLRSSSESRAKKSKRNSVIEFMDKVATNTSEALHLKRERRHSSFDVSNVVTDARPRPRQMSSVRSRLTPPQSPSPTSVDPFNSSPASSSFFIDLDLADAPTFKMKTASTSPVTRRASSKRTSFLSLSPSPTIRTKRPSSFFAFAKNSRPSSVHSSSARDCDKRYSTYSYLSKIDMALDFCEELEETSSPERSDSTDLGDLDWRQFHMELMGENGEQD